MQAEQRVELAGGRACALDRVRAQALLSSAKERQFSRARHHPPNRMWPFEGDRHSMGKSTGGRQRTISLADQEAKPTVTSFALGYGVRRCVV